MRVCLCMIKQPKALSWLMKQDSIQKVMMLIWQQNILTKENKELIVEDVSDRELAVRKRIEGVMDNARYQEEYRKLEELVKRKEHGDVAYYHKAVKDILSSWKDEYRGYSARDN